MISTKIIFIESIDDLENVIGMKLKDLISMIDRDDILKKQIREFFEALLNEDYIEKLRETLNNAIRGTVLDVITLILVLLASCSKYLANIIAVRFSKLLTSTMYRVDDETLYRFSQELGIGISYNAYCFKKIITAYTESSPLIQCLRFRIPLFEYLEIAKDLLSEPSWKLTNLVLDGGYVYLDRDKVLRLVEEKIKHRLLNSMTNLCLDLRSRYSEVLDEVTRLQKELLEKTLNSVRVHIVTKSSKKLSSDERKSLVSTDISTLNIENIRSERELLELAEKCFPPCIRELLHRLLAGENLSHHQRFALATFLINIGVDLDLILQLFTHSPDFSEKIARYQIEHLAGLRGSRKKYITYNCATMRALGLCISECGVKNPLVYFLKKTRAGIS